jgi:hypothetical protein
VTGIVDESLRALLDVTVAADKDSVKKTVKSVDRHGIQRLPCDSASADRAPGIETGIDHTGNPCRWPFSRSGNFYVLSRLVRHRVSNAGRRKRRRVTAARDNVARKSEVDDRLHREERRAGLMAPFSLIAFLISSPNTYRDRKS